MATAGKPPGTGTLPRSSRTVLCGSARMGTSGAAQRSDPNLDESPAAVVAIPPGMADGGKRRMPCRGIVYRRGGDDGAEKRSATGGGLNRNHGITKGDVGYAAAGHFVIASA